MSISIKKHKILHALVLCSIMLAAAACSNPNTEPKKEKQQTAPNVTKKEAEVEKATPEKLKNAIYQSLGFTAEKGAQKVSDIAVDQNDHVTIKFVPNANAAGNLLPFTIQQDITNILWGIKNSHLKVSSVQLIVTGQEAPDQSGNTTQKEIVNVTYSNETIQKTNFESINTDIILSLADTTTYVEPGLMNK